MFDIDNDKVFKDKILTHFAKIFESFDDYEDIAYIYDIGDLLEDYADALNSTGLEYDYGMSKIVIFDDSFPGYVFKIPIYGCCNEYGDYVPYPVNYCELEQKIYKDAEKNAVSDMLCPICYVGMAGTYPIWVSYEIDRMFDTDDIDKLSQNSREAAEKSNKGFCIEMEPTDLAFFYDSYGIRQTNKMISLLRHYGVNDCHSANMGWLNDYPVLIDYAGFRGIDDGFFD